MTYKFILVLCYVPEKAIVSPGTLVTWFNGDADHDHKITLTNEVNPENIIFDSDDFAFNEASNPIVLNDTGTFNYYETDVNNEDTHFVMNGTIEVVDQQGLNANTQPYRCTLCECEGFNMPK